MFNRICFLLQSERLSKVLECVNEVHALCGVLALDFGQTVSDVHPSLHRMNQEQSTNISDSTLEGLEQAIIKLKTERKVRVQKVCYYCFVLDDFLLLFLHLIAYDVQLRDTVASLFELWNLMDSPQEEKNRFSRITSILRLSESEITDQGVLSMETIEQV